MAEIVYKEEGKHCAFTDLAFHDRYYYLCFRIGNEHMFGKSHILIMRSRDGKKWEKYSRTCDYLDIRDPRLMVDQNKLFLIANFLVHDKQIVKTGFLVKGKITDGYTKTIIIKGSENKFATSISKLKAFCYDPTTNGRNSVFNIETGGEETLPSFEDSTEGAFYGRSVFVRRDYSQNYWLKATENGYGIEATKYMIHCPYIFQSKLLGREINTDVDPYDWNDLWNNQSKLKMWEIKKDLTLKEIKIFNANVDCGYFGYANGLVSYYSNYDKSKPEETAIFIEKI